jgi:hypothetical protein
MRHFVLIACAFSTQTRHRREVRRRLSSALYRKAPQETFHLAPWRNGQAVKPKSSLLKPQWRSSSDDLIYFCHLESFHSREVDRSKPFVSPQIARLPHGGKYRQIRVDIESTKLASKALTPEDVVNAKRAEPDLAAGVAKDRRHSTTVRTIAMRRPSPTSTIFRSHMPTGRPCSRGCRPGA